MKSPLSLGELLSSLAPGSRVLDLGCGGGTFRYVDFPALAIDALDEQAHEKTRDFPPNARFVCAGASAIPEQDAVYDLVIVNFAFEHFPDPVAAIKEIERVAKNRAYVWISIPNARSFEDQLYRNIFAGGGHLQSLTLERFLRLAYENTCFKLASFFELPAGFTYLDKSEELRHLAWAIIDALKRSAAIAVQARSAYIFILRKYSEAGSGFFEFIRTCHSCGTPDDGKSTKPEDSTQAWICANCGACNETPRNLSAIQLDKVEKEMQFQWDRLPDTHPVRLREMYDERTQWAQLLQKELDNERRISAELRVENDHRGIWGLDLQRELQSQRDAYVRLKSQFDERGRWALELDETVKKQQSEIVQLMNPMAYVKLLWKKFWRAR